MPFEFDGLKVDNNSINETPYLNTQTDSQKILVLTDNRENFQFLETTREAEGQINSEVASRLEPTFYPLTTELNQFFEETILILDLSQVSNVATSNSLDDLYDDLYEWLEDLYQTVRGQLIALIPTTYSLEEKTQLLNRGVTDYLDIESLNADSLYETILKCTQRKTSSWQNFLQQVVDVSPNQIFVKNTKSQYVLVNQALAKRHNFESERFIGKTDIELIEGLGKEKALAYMEQDQKLLEHKGDLFFPEEVVKDERGRERFIKTVKRVLYDDDGNAKFILGTSMDITDIRQAEQELLQTYKVIENSPLIFFKCTTQGSGETLSFDFLSENFERYGFETTALVDGSTNFLEDICHPDDIENLKKYLRKAFREGQNEFQIPFRIFTKDKTLRWLEATILVEQGSEHHIHKSQGFFLDITEKKRNEIEVKGLIERIEYQASHDELTGLPNRRLFDDHILQAMNYAKHSQKRVAILFLKLEGFKLINDTHGQALGDTLLEKVINRFKLITREVDSIARVDGVKLAVLINNMNSKGDALGMAQRYLECLATPFSVGDEELSINANIGVSCYPEDGQSSSMLVNYAEIAMDFSKQRGINNIQIFTENLVTEARELATIESNLRLAVERQEFLLHYQPQISFDTGEMVGVEALLRWQRPEIGLVPPGKFIPVAEETLLIIDIGKWVLFESCAQAARWHKEGFPITISVNVAAPQFVHENFVETIKLALYSNGLEARYLEIEVTEGVVMHNISLVAKRLQEIRDLGVTIALDDFGTGFSSLQYLQNLPCDKLKIDRSFIMNIGVSQDDRGDRALVENIMRLGNSFDLEVIAEGIETEEQAEYLQALGCGYAQGFYYARPVPAEEVVLKE